MFISIEGVDGSGKTTQVKMLKKYLKEKEGISAFATTDPPPGKLGSEVREFVCNTDISPDVQLLLITASRRDWIDRVIKPKVDNGQWVISDRFIHSSWIYQDTIKAALLQSEFCYNLHPHLTIVLDIPAKESLKRLLDSGRRLDRLESVDLEQIKQRCKAFKSLEALADVVCIDALQPKKEVTRCIIDTLIKKGVLS